MEALQVRDIIIKKDLDDSLNLILGKGEVDRLVNGGFNYPKLIDFAIREAYISRIENETLRKAAKMLDNIGYLLFDEEENK